jgi:hypothetical protein
MCKAAVVASVAVPLQHLPMETEKPTEKPVI